jgi:type II secretion system protein I
VRGSRGFTLIEVLAALVIVALGMAAVLTTVGSSASSVAYLRDKTLAQWIALNQIASIRLSGSLPAVGTTDGNVDFAGRSWRWHQDVTSGGVAGVNRIEVSVEPADSSQHGSKDQQADWLATETGVFGNTLQAPQIISAYSEYSIPSGPASPSSPSESGE